MMQPRGQLWFELQRVCRDFREFSGLQPQEALRIMTVVLGNLLADTQTELETLLSPKPPTAAGSPEAPPT